MLETWKPSSDCAIYDGSVARFYFSIYIGSLKSSGTRRTRLPWFLQEHCQLVPHKIFFVVVSEVVYMIQICCRIESCKGDAFKTAMSPELFGKLGSYRRLPYFVGSALPQHVQRFKFSSKGSRNRRSPRLR